MRCIAMFAPSARLPVTTQCHHKSCPNAENLPRSLMNSPSHSSDWPCDVQQRIQQLPRLRPAGSQQSARDSQVWACKYHLIDICCIQKIACKERTQIKVPPGKAMKENATDFESPPRSQYRLKSFCASALVHSPYRCQLFSPKVIQPRHTGETRRPDLPRGLRSLSGPTGEASLCMVARSVAGMDTECR